MKKPWKRVIAGSVLLVALVVASTVVSVQSRFHARDEAAATATHFLRDLNAHDYAGAHALLDTPQQRVITVAVLRTAEEQIERKHGKPIGRVGVDEYNVDQRETRARFFCDNAYQQESEPIHIVLRKTAAGWRVLEYRYDSSPA